MFWSMFAGLTMAFVIVLYFLLREEKSSEKRQADYLRNIDELKNELAKKDKEKAEILIRSKDASGIKEKDLNRQILELKDKLLESQDNARSENLSKVALEKKAQDLQEQSAKLNKEMVLMKEMYEGLKIQYNELERDMEKTQ